MSRTKKYLLRILNEIEDDGMEIKNDMDPHTEQNKTMDEVMKILLAGSNGAECTCEDNEDSNSKKEFYYDMDELRRWKERNNELFDIPYYRPIDTYTRKFGKILLFLKRIVRKACRSLVEPICIDATEFNGSVTASINALFNNSIVTEAFTNYQIQINRDVVEKIEKLTADRKKWNDELVSLRTALLEIQQRWERDQAKEQQRLEAKHIREHVEEVDDKLENLIIQLEKLSERLEITYELNVSLEESMQSMAPQIEIEKLRDEQKILEQKLLENNEKVEEFRVKADSEKETFISLLDATKEGNISLLNAAKEEILNESFNKNDGEILKLELSELRKDLAESINNFDLLLTDTEINLLRKLRTNGRTHENLTSKEQTISNENICSDRKYQGAYPLLDYFKFENYFRGSRKGIKECQSMYVPYFQGKGKILDLGCGRGEFLELLKGNGIDGFGIDAYPEFVEYCEFKGLQVSCGKVPDVLTALEEESVGGIFASQLVEHITFEELMTLCKEAYRIMTPGACMIIETPNPSCLSTYINSFYMDPSHIKPVHPKTLQYLLEQQGFGNIEVLYTEQSKVGYRLPLLKGSEIENLKEFNDGINLLSDVIFGSQDYAIIARK